MYKLNQLASLLLMAWITAPVLAQSTLDWPVGEFSPYQLDSGMRGNPEERSGVVYRATVSVENAAWVRLYFDKAELDTGSFIRMTSAFDNEVQELDAAGIAMWNDTSAYFNGDTVYLELMAGPETSKNRLVLDRLAVNLVDPAGERGLPCADDDCGMCGADNRVPSNENWSGRLMPVGCTGSIYNEDSCAVTAGHCIMSGLVMQFNVPNSSSNCSTSQPPVADQFPITSYLYTNGGVGNDWAALTTGTNVSGQTPYERYGMLRPIATALGNSGDAVAVWGFGVDNNDPTRNQTQQTHSATIQTRYGTYYTHWVDITYGNSGSGFIKNNEIIGIITHCPCPGIATRVDLAAFAAARDQLCGQAGGYCLATSSSTAFEFISRVQVGSINNPSGSSGYADYTSLSTNMSIGTGYSITVTLDTTWSSDVGGLWVDWNQDEDFSDAGETITTSWSGLGPYTTTITPPSGAATGGTRMRVRIQDGSSDPTPSSCGTTSYGEVEDYTINVVGGCSPPDCDDGNACTDDVCDNGTCVHTNNTNPCTDGDACTTGDACAGGACAGGGPADCDDGNECTNDSCDPVMGCLHADNSDPCDDDDACNGADTCGGGTCSLHVGDPCAGGIECNDLCTDLGGGAYTCSEPAGAPCTDDGEVCTDDVCDGFGACDHPPNTAPCDDGNACTTGDACAGGACAGGGPADCDDGNECTNDSCDPAMGCQYVDNSDPCDDDDACNGADTCGGGTCSLHVGDPCAGGIECNDLCTDLGGGAYTCSEPAGAPCTDDGEVCTDDVCDGFGACDHPPNTAPCDDGNACTVNDVCVGGACTGGQPLDCNDGDACTADSCDPATGCVHTVICQPVELSINGPAQAVWGSMVTFDIWISAGSPVDLRGYQLSVPCAASGGSAGSVDFSGTMDVDQNRPDWAMTLPPCGGCPGFTFLDDGSCSSPPLRDPRFGWAALDSHSTVGIGPYYLGEVTYQVATDASGTFAIDLLPGGGTFLRDPNSDSIPYVLIATTLTIVECLSGSDCDDFDPCTLNQCNASFACDYNAPVDCDDGNACTDDSCDPASGCQNSFNTDPCDDGDACTTGDICSAGTCTGGGPTDCDDGDACTDDSCDPASGCQYSFNTDPCDDGNACTSGDACSGGTCTGGGPADCDDGNACTDDSCDPASGCQYSFNADPCDDGNACTTGDACSGGTCTGGGTPDCDDGNPCTDDSCDPASGCQNSFNTDPCDDGDACTTGDTCSSGTCTGGGPADCDDGNACTDDSCDPGSGCQYSLNADPCDDGNACTTGDTCSGGTCTGSGPTDCDDGNTCTDDSCDPASGCQYSFNADPCNDGNACTTGDTCSGGTCTGGGTPDCDDGNACTDDSCDPESGCQYLFNTDPCDDGDACTSGDTCSSGTCTGGGPADCDDGNACTDDSCDPASGCQYAHNTDPCEDGNACTTSDACSGGTCTGGQPPDCDDGNVCTHDACHPVVGCVHVDNTEPCPDDVFCNGVETCAGGSCQPGADPCPDQMCDEPGGVCMDCVADSDCDDGNDCTIDTCDAQSDCIHEYREKRFADLVPLFCPPDCPQPDVDDILCLLNDFADGPTPGTCADGAADLAPCGGDGRIDVDDILYLLDAFGQINACPHPCPGE